VSGKPRLLFLTDAWPPQVNGVALTSQIHVRYLNAAGVETKVVSPDMFMSAPCPGYREIRLSFVTPSTIARIIEGYRPDFIHINTEGPLGLAGVIACKRQGLRFTTSFRTKFPEYLNLRIGTPLSWTYALLRWFHNSGAGCLVPTASLRDELAARGFRDLRHWARGVDHELFKPRADTDLGFPRPIFLSVGRVAIEKNLTAFLDLDLPGSKVIVGDGPARAALSKTYPDAHFLGRLSIEQLAQAYAAADVFVFPSLTDTFGNVLLEALASGLPVAAFPVTGPKDVVTDPKVGVLDADLRKAALAALNLSRDAAREFALRFTWEASVEQFLSNLSPARESVDFSPAVQPVV
jgi:glycosyltransferase involved in cell wall biosynthesis